MHVANKAQDRPTNTCANPELSGIPSFFRVRVEQSKFASPLREDQAAEIYFESD